MDDDEIDKAFLAWRDELFSRPTQLMNTLQSKCFVAAGLLDLDPSGEGHIEPQHPLERVMESMLTRHGIKTNHLMRLFLCQCGSDPGEYEVIVLGIVLARLRDEKTEGLTARYFSEIWPEGVPTEQTLSDMYDKLKSLKSEIASANRASRQA